MKTELKIKVFTFEHVYKGDHSTVMPNTPLPGDALLADVSVDGISFAVCAIAKANARTVQPAQFEAVIKAFLASLARHLGEPVPSDIETRLIGTFSPGVH